MIGKESADKVLSLFKSTHGSLVGSGELFGLIAAAVEDAYQCGVEDERAACAKIADEHAGHGCECAYLIRSRGGEEKR